FLEAHTTTVSKTLNGFTCLGVETIQMFTERIKNSLVITFLPVCYATIRTKAVVVPSGFESPYFFSSGGIKCKCIKRSRRCIQHAIYYNGITLNLCTIVDSICIF